MTSEFVSENDVNPTSRCGKVFLVGAGPGDPGLITLRAVELLRSADFVVYDYLVDPAILCHLSPKAKAICVGGHASGRVLSQEEIVWTVIDSARKGQQVVRLKGGDPSVFGHLAEEMDALRAAGIPFEIVPGVTAALAAAAYTELPLTHSEASSAVAFVTGHQKQSKEVRPLDYGRLAGFPGTLVFYMGVTTAHHWSSRLIEAGKSPDCPVAILYRSTWPEQQTIRCTLGTVAETLERLKVRPPAVIVIGEVVGFLPEDSWFTRRRLFGTTVLVARPRDEALETAAKLRQLGARVLIQPAIEILPPKDWSAVDAAIERIGEFDWVVFSSVHGVRFFVNRVWERCKDLRALAGPSIAAIGPGTAAALERYFLRADLLPKEFRAEALAQSLMVRSGGGKFLLIRASRGRDVLPQMLTQAGAEVEQVVAYQSVDVGEVDQAVAEAIAAEKVDWVLVTSSSIARSLVRLFGEKLRRTRLASISPITTQTLKECGFTPQVEATQYTLDGLIAAISGDPSAG